jgi:hypothetical protein
LGDICKQFFHFFLFKVDHECAVIVNADANMFSRYCVLHIFRAICAKSLLYITPSAAVGYNWPYSSFNHPSGRHA